MNNITEKFSKEKMIFKNIMSTVGLCILVSQPLYGMDGDDQGNPAPYKVAFKQKEQASIINAELQKKKKRVKSLLGKFRKLELTEESELCTLCIDIYNGEKLKEQPDPQKIKNYVKHIVTYYDSISEASPKIDKVIKKSLGEKYREQYEKNIKAAEECKENKDRAAVWLTLASKSLNLAVEFGDIPAYVMWANLRLNDRKVSKEDFYKAVNYMDRASKENNPQAVEWKKNNPRPRYMGETLINLEKNLAMTDLGLQWIGHSIQILSPIASYVLSFTKIPSIPIPDLTTGSNYLSNICGSARGTLTWYRTGDTTHLMVAAFKAVSVALAVVRKHIEDGKKQTDNSCNDLKSKIGDQKKSRAVLQGTLEDSDKKVRGYSQSLIGYSKDLDAATERYNKIKQEIALHANRWGVTQSLSNWFYNTDNKNINCMNIEKAKIDELSENLFEVYDNLDVHASFYVSLVNEYNSNCEIAEVQQLLLKSCENQNNYYEAMWEKYGAIKQVYDFCAANMNYQELATSGQSLLNNSSSNLARKAEEIVEKLRPMIPLFSFLQSIEQQPEALSSTENAKDKIIQEINSENDLQKSKEYLNSLMHNIPECINKSILDRADAEMNLPVSPDYR